MANQFKSGEDAAGYLFDVAIRKGKDAARKEYERISGNLPQDQVDAMYKSIQNINDQKNIADDKGLGAAKVQRYREKAAKNMPVNYDKEFGKKPEPAPKPVAKPTPKPAAKVEPKKPVEDEKGFLPYGGPTTTGNTVRKLLNIKADKPPENSRPAIGTGMTQMLSVPKFEMKPSGKAPK